jgi:hypothetical protein
VSDSDFADIRKRLTSAATVSTYRLGSLAARLMPGPMAATASASIGLGASFASPTKRRMIERHLQRVNPKLRTALRRPKPTTTPATMSRAFGYRRWPRRPSENPSRSMGGSTFSTVSSRAMG